MKLSCFVFWSLIVIRSVVGLQPEIVVLRAIRGQPARLPCGQGKVFLDGPDSYVLWLKKDRDLLYRYPNADSDSDSGMDSQDRDMFGRSCDASGCYDDTSLKLKRVSERDSGIYRCRVHYQASPSVDYVIELRLVDTPGTPKIINEHGIEIKRGNVGPLSLGSNLTLICEVDNADLPETLLYWRRNGAVIERTQSANDRSLRATVHVNNITRDELDAHYECLAQNADVTEPLSASVIVKMYLPPLLVEIRLNNNFDFEAGQPRVVDCVVVGCVPPPSITWHLGDTMLRPNVHKELHDGNYTVSSLSLAPSLRDSQHELVCQAHNSHLPTHVFEDKVVLNVGYRPICVPGSEDMVGVIPQEAESIVCIVEASPEPMQISWTMPDSRMLYTSVKRVPGYPNRYMSTLTWLPHQSDIGLLHCRATNSFGEQRKPCTYTLVHGGPPMIPDCVFMKYYPDTLKVQCKKSWDGGRPQTIHLEIQNAKSLTVRNVTDDGGHFQLSNVNINEAENLTAIVYASNARGRSAARTLFLQIVKPSPTSVPEDDPTYTWAGWIEAAAGGIAVTIAIAGIVIYIKALKDSQDEPEMNPDLVPDNDGVFHREPDFARDDRMHGSTNITVNQLAACQNQYTATPVPSCRVLVGCGGHALTSSDPCPTNQHSYYV